MPRASSPPILLRVTIRSKDGELLADTDEGLPDSARGSVIAHTIDDVPLAVRDLCVAFDPTCPRAPLACYAPLTHSLASLLSRDQGVYVWTRLVPIGSDGGHIQLRVACYRPSWDDVTFEAGRIHVIGEAHAPPTPAHAAIVNLRRPA